MGFQASQMKAEGNKVPLDNKLKVLEQHTTLKYQFRQSLKTRSLALLRISCPGQQEAYNTLFFKFSKSSPISEQCNAAARNDSEDVGTDVCQISNNQFGRQ